MSLKHNPKIGVVIPLANEENTIDELLTRVLAHLPQNTMVFCVLDNVSKDNTIKKVQEWGKKDPRIILIWAPENRCVVDAYFRGYKEALKAECDWILEMDGGLSHKPEEIPRFLKAMEEGHDFAGGSRFMKGGKYIKPRMRYLISMLGTWITNTLVGTKMKDMTSGFECFTREALEHVIGKGVKSRAHFFQTEIRTMMHEFHWAEIPITYKNPSSQVGQSNIKEAFKHLWAIRKAKKTNHSLENALAFSFFGVSCAVAFFLMLFGSMRDVVLRFIQDDAFYYFGIANNWKELGFSSFDGITPTNGYHPLWEWMLIIPSSWFTEIETFIRVGSALGAVFLFVAGIWTYKALKERKNPSAPLVWYWLAGSLAFATIYGMESPLTILLTAGLIIALHKALKNRDLKGAILCGGLSGLLFLSRIDTLMWVAALDFMILILFLRPGVKRKKLWAPLITFGLVQGLIMAGYFAYNVIEWGHLFPLSAMVKAGRTTMFSLDIPMSQLFALALLITAISAIVAAKFAWFYLKKRHHKKLNHLVLPTWLALANLMYMAMIVAKGGPETYNWYFVNIVFSGAILIPHFIENYNFPGLKISHRVKFRLVMLFCVLLLGVTIYGKIAYESNFAGSYDRAIDLANFPERSIVFASNDCGILGSISMQSCLNMDGLTNTFEFQQSLKNDRLDEWLHEAGLNAFFVAIEEDPITVGTVVALPGIHNIRREAEVKLEPWPLQGIELKSIDLYRVLTEFD